MIDENAAEDVPVTEFSANSMLHISAPVDRGLERVIANVVSNACLFSPVDRPVRLTAGLTATGIELLVIDHGPGTRDPRRRIPGASSEQSVTRVRDEDLALSVAEGFIKLLEGELRFDDTPGGGLTVAICLSAASAPASTIHVEESETLG